MTSAGPPPGIEAAEFRARQRALARRLEERGLDAALVWSSCGSALDAFGHVFYLTNHYTPVPRVNVDIPPFMTGWGQTAVVVDADGRTTLVSENGDIRHDLIVHDELRYSRDVYGECVAAVRGAGLGEGRIGLVGASCLPLAAWQVISEALPAARFEPADDILFRHRARKSAAEISFMRHASLIGCEIQNRMLT